MTLGEIFDKVSNNRELQADQSTEGDAARRAALISAMVKHGHGTELQLAIAFRVFYGWHEATVILRGDTEIRWEERRAVMPAIIADCHKIQPYE